MRLPRKLENDLILKLCANIKEHPEDWRKDENSFRSSKSNHETIAIWQDLDFWIGSTIYSPQQLHIRWVNKFRLNNVIRWWKKKTSPISLVEHLQRNQAAKLINDLPSSYNDPLIKYRERFGTEPTEEIVKFAKTKAATTAQ